MRPVDCVPQLAGCMSQLAGCVTQFAGRVTQSAKFVMQSVGPVMRSPGRAPHSRITVIGSTRAARRTGTSSATVAQTSSVTTEAPSAIGSNGGTP
jgi:hypothetical protein